MRTRLATRLVLSHLLVVVVGLGLAGTGLLSQTRRYFVDAERASLFVQARVAANSCDALCLSSRTSTANVTNGQLPSASNVTQRKAQSSSNVQIATGFYCYSAVAGICFHKSFGQFMLQRFLLLLEVTE